MLNTKPHKLMSRNILRFCKQKKTHDVLYLHSQLNVHQWCRVVQVQLLGIDMDGCNICATAWQC